MDPGACRLLLHLLEAMEVQGQKVVVQKLMGSRLHHFPRLNILDHVVCLDMFDNIGLEPIMTVPMLERMHFLQDRNWIRHVCHH